MQNISCPTSQKAVKYTDLLFQLVIIINFYCRNTQLNSLCIIYEFYDRPLIVLSIKRNTVVLKYSKNPYIRTLNFEGQAACGFLFNVQMKCFFLLLDLKEQ